MTTLTNISSTKSVFGTVIEGYGGPNPKPAWELKPGEKYVDNTDITCWYIYAAPAAEADSNSSSEDSITGQTPFWSGQLYKDDVATINLDNGAAIVNSRPVQANSGGVMVGQVMGDFSFSDYNCAARMPRRSVPLPKIIE